MKFNPDEYETVKERKLRFYADHPDGRIIVKSLSENPIEYAFIRAEIYLNAEDQKNGLPRAVGYGLEIRLMEKSISRDGREYEAVNYASWTENCEESAIGRALDNAGYASNKKPSREEMEKAKRMGNLPEHKKTQSAKPTQSKGKYTEAQCGLVGKLLAEILPELLNTNLIESHDITKLAGLLLKGVDKKRASKIIENLMAIKNNLKAIVEGNADIEVQQEAVKLTDWARKHYLKEQ